MSADVVDGLSQQRRREIYVALHQMGMEASESADRRFPFGELSTNPGVAKKQMADRQAYYQSLKKKGRMALVKKYKVDGAILDRITAEGDSKKWPLGN
jgi:hypothetical protein